MREIKFRAWHKDAKQMFYSRTLEMQYSNNTGDGSHYMPVSFDLGDLRHNKVTEYRDDGDEVEELLILMQYTGLKDKNGKEIYEGDLFDAWEGRSKYAVEWADNAGFHLVWVNGDIDDGKRRHYFPMLMAQFQFEPVGNIYENPELAK